MLCNALWLCCGCFFHPCFFSVFFLHISVQSVVHVYHFDKKETHNACKALSEIYAFRTTSLGQHFLRNHNFHTCVFCAPGLTQWRRYEFSLFLCLPSIWCVFVFEQASMAQAKTQKLPKEKCLQLHSSDLWWNFPSCHCGTIQTASAPIAVIIIIIGISVRLVDNHTIKRARDREIMGRRRDEKERENTYTADRLQTLAPLCHGEERKTMNCKGEECFFCFNELHTCCMYECAENHECRNKSDDVSICHRRRRRQSHNMNIWMSMPLMLSIRRKWNHKNSCDQSQSNIIGNRVVD